MNLKSIKDLIRKIPFPTGSDYGKSEFVRVADVPRPRYLPVFSLIIFFLLIAFLGDLWPVKNVSEQCYGYVERGNILSLSMDIKLSPSMRYSSGFTARYYESLPYQAIIKLFHLFIPYRLVCLRMVSILSTSVALFFIYRLTTILFCRSIGMLLIILLVTSPVCVENLRAFGYIPLTNAIVSIVIYLLVASLNRRRIVIKTVLAAMFSYLILSLYVIGRLIIILPVIIFGIYFKRYWRNLVIFAGIFIALILILDNTLNDTRFNLKNAIFIHPEWLKPASVELPIDEGVIYGRFVVNSKWAMRYLGFSYSPLYDQEEDLWLKPPRLINPFFTPFLIVGLLVCLVRRKLSNVVLLTWVFLLFIVPHASSWLPIRRVVLALTPIYLLIAVGMWWVYNFISAFSNSGSYKKRIAVSASIIIILISTYNVYAYFSTAAKPLYNYSRAQLKQLAEYVSKKGADVDAIRYNRAAESLLWGNPYFDRPIITKELVRKLEFDRVRDHRHREIRPSEILEQIEYARQEGGNILYIHAMEEPDPYLVESHLSEKDEYQTWRYSDMGYVNKSMREEVELEQLPGIDEVYFLYVR